MSPASPRDLELTARRLEAALARHLGVREPVVSGLSSPKAGYSNETMYFHADSVVDGHPRHDDLVLRVEPTGHQLFVTPDAARQAQVMQALARHPGTPVPEILFIESDPAELGAPYYVMRQVHGRVPGDVPSWHRKGWVRDLSEADQFKVHDNGLSALVALHRIDPRDGFEFLAPAGTDTAGTALDRYLAELEQWYEWCGDARHYGADILAEALTYLLANRPDDEAERIVWGDARVGNLLYADDLSVAAMFDWEAATLGPPGIDLGWWLMFDDFLSEAGGTTRLPGVPDRAATIARYHELGGIEVPDIDYYELLACVVMALINSRLADLLIADGLAVDIASSYPLRSTTQAERRLATLTATR